jgi:hypothetical protein
MKIFSLFAFAAAVLADEPFSKACRDVTNRVSRTNSWTCRDCFNLRVNVNLNNVRNAFNWDGFVYLSFTEETSVVKFAGPVVSIDFDGNDDNGNFRYKVSFIPGHEFGDNRIDFNAEFRELGGKPKLEWAWLCARLNGVCDEVAIPIKIQGQGMWQCVKKRDGRSNVCRVVCSDGRNAYNGNAKARCDTFTNRVNGGAGNWRTNRNANPTCKAEDAPNRVNGQQAAYIN